MNKINNDITNIINIDDIIEVKDKYNELVSLINQLNTFINTVNQTEFDNSNPDNGTGYYGHNTLYVRLLNKILAHYEWLNVNFYRKILTGCSTDK